MTVFLANLTSLHKLFGRQQQSRQVVMDFTRALVSSYIVQIASSEPYTECVYIGDYFMWELNRDETHNRSRKKFDVKRNYLMLSTSKSILQALPPIKQANMKNVLKKLCGTLVV